MSSRRLVSRFAISVLFSVPIRTQWNRFVWVTSQVADELFSHCDTMDLKRFRPLLWERIISMGVIRPARTMYIGIEETCVLIARNLSDNTLIYWWGDASGPDAEKMKLCACPERGEVPAGSTEEMKITLVPMKEGYVQRLHIPCYVGDSQKMIILEIECNIQPFHVSFYLPVNNDEPFELKSNFTRVEWGMDNLKVALDLEEESRSGMKLLDKYRMQEERELMNTNLDQGSLFKDTSAGPSEADVDIEELGERVSGSSRTSEVVQVRDLDEFERSAVIEPITTIKISELTTESGKDSREDVAPSGHVVPFLETIAPGPTQPNVIEFMGLTLRTVTKKTFIIKNETPILSKFYLCTKNFYPVKCSCEWKTKTDRIKFMYKQIYGRNKDVIEEILRRSKQSESGVVIYVDPSNSDIGPFEAVPVDVYVFADTWGIYIDELDIDITGLPRFALAVCVQVVESPISLSIFVGASTKSHVLKFGTVAAGARLHKRKVSIKNTSVVPIAVDWHTFLVTPKTETMPFNIVVDLCTPFTDKLARELRTRNWKSRSDAHLEKHETDAIKSRRNKGSWTRNSSDLNGTECSVPYSRRGTDRPSKSHEYANEERDEYSNEIDQNEIKGIDDTEFKISLLPYRGALNTNACLVRRLNCTILSEVFKNN
ncbi:LOW QUALITY PROTEIN: uncharacterized protein LOC143148405 [Ptiloglossa arizonensis]|uniref:LOW QUALITY PROTEIN: uncharacterized protein LOC143148405 n=1 Tax=Ptiloglossa arizonensis TaxID=3350558 RepID=UPI003F9F2B54